MAARTAVTGATLEPPPLGGLALAAAGAIGALTTMTALWRVSAPRIAARAQRLLAALTREGHALASEHNAEEAGADTPRIGGEARDAGSGRGR